VLLSMHLSQDWRITAGDALLVASALAAIITAFSLVRRKILQPARARFAHTIAEASREVIVTELGPVKAQVADLHRKLSSHLNEETNEIGGIHASIDTLSVEMRETFAVRSAEFAEGIAPWRERFVRLEASHAEILGRLDGLADQAATDSAKVIAAVHDQRPAET
jgi:hypothetical protein